MGKEYNYNNGFGKGEISVERFTAIKMRKTVRSLALMLVFCLAIFGLSSCSSSNNPSIKALATNASTATAAPTKQPMAKSTTSSLESSSSSSTSSFTNAFGTATTKCAHPGCNNLIASSGDTNCCTTHSKKCLECGKYIDEDATYCISCIEKAATASKNSTSSSTTSSSSSSGSFTNAYGSPTTKCAYPGCNKPVASSGDTNCCAAHSNHCLNCGKLIDSDAMYCMSCLSKAVQQGSSSGSGSSSSSYSSDWGSDYGSDWDDWSWLFDD